jgi:hypothetical protein
MVEGKNGHTLEDLFSDSGMFDEKEAVRVLLPLVTIQKSTNQVFIKDNGITNEKKILAYCLAKKLLKVRGRIEDDFVSAQEVHKMTGIKKGTIDPMFKVLKERGLLVGKGQQEIPTPKVKEVIDILSSK